MHVVLYKVMLMYEFMYVHRNYEHVLYSGSKETLISAVIWFFLHVASFFKIYNPISRVLFASWAAHHCNYCATTWGLLTTKLYCMFARTDVLLQIKASFFVDLIIPCIMETKGITCVLEINWFKCIAAHSTYSICREQYLKYILYLNPKPCFPIWQTVAMDFFSLKTWSFFSTKKWSLHSICDYVNLNIVLTSRTSSMDSITACRTLVLTLVVFSEYDTQTSYQRSINMCATSLHNTLYSGAKGMHWGTFI